MNISPVIYQLFGVACLYALLLIAKSQDRKYACNRDRDCSHDNQNPR
jgi:uncharacterized membrane protein YuzA (DUF378 family)